jgi:ATP-dependent DNA helicase RecG
MTHFREDDLKILLSPLERLSAYRKEFEEAFQKLRIRSLWDLLRHYPRRYQDRSQLIPLAEVGKHKEVAVKGEVISVRRLKLRFKRRYRTEIVIRDASGTLTAVFFARASFYHKAFKRGEKVIFFGRSGLYKGRPQIHQPEFEKLSADIPARGKITPVYPLSEGLEQYQLRQLIDETLRLTRGHLPDTVPAKYMEKRCLPPLQRAYEIIHQPENLRQLEEADKRLDYEELFMMQLGLVSRRKLVRKEKKLRPTLLEKGVEKRIRELLPFPLTGAQERVLAQIVRDFAAPSPMNRLLQGDVGSGKTIVAIIALLIKIANRQQVALMAPTEILAEQHFNTLQRLLPEARFRMALLSGKTKGKEREALKKDLASGEISLLVGTHALIYSSIAFQELSLVIIDEQHKFGVLQRADLQRKGFHPDVLVMTATPIPRTLSLPLYGDLDVSVLDEFPPGRKSILTKKVHPRHRQRMNQNILKELRKGRQAYCIYPLIEESEKMDLQAATEGFKSLKNGVFQDFRIGLLHGRLSPSEKQEVMEKFKNKDIDILVATVVIEVGIDVPNASVMVIENAERFGLAQLHQLRGRIGRGGHASFCYLMADPKSENAQLRLAALCRSADGFKVAEMDLELRGAGDYFGTRQHGQPGSRIGRILHNLPLISEARQDAVELLQEDPLLEKKENRGCHFGYRLQFAYTLNLTSIA